MPASLGKKKRPVISDGPRDQSVVDDYSVIEWRVSIDSGCDSDVT